jgi:hypothetical protein
VQAFSFVQLRGRLYQNKSINSLPATLSGMKRGKLKAISAWGKLSITRLCFECHMDSRAFEKAENGLQQRESIPA